ncbi:hypothetical protein KC323_g51 [Hortaea werneckii]|nr:hypothetical protein KC323_g51 [Hortaea werneckii]
MFNYSRETTMKPMSSRSDATRLMRTVSTYPGDAFLVNVDRNLLSDSNISSTLQSTQSSSVRTRTCLKTPRAAALCQAIWPKRGIQVQFRTRAMPWALFTMRVSWYWFAALLRSSEDYPALVPRPASLPLKQRRCELAGAVGSWSALGRLIRAPRLLPPQACKTWALSIAMDSCISKVSRSAGKSLPRPRNTAGSRRPVLRRRFNLATPSALPKLRPPSIENSTIFTAPPVAKSRHQASALNITSGRTVTSSTKFMNFYPFDDMQPISPRLMLFLTGDVVYSRDFSAGAYARAAESEEITWILRAGDNNISDILRWLRLRGAVPLFQCQSFSSMTLSSLYGDDESPVAGPKRSVAGEQLHSKPSQSMAAFNNAT